MKKKLCTCSIILAMVFSLFSTQVMAYENFQEAENPNVLENEEVVTYDENSIDWENIDEIYVLKYSGYDQFIEDAISRNITVIFDEYAYVNPRYTYFNSLSWITRGGVRSLSISPKNPFTINKEGSWGELARYFQYHPMYTGISNSSKWNSMYNQYVCHVDYARGFKTPWNIEPATPDKGYWGFVGSSCN